MAFLITPRGPLSQQPQYPAPINWGNSITRGLIFAGLPGVSFNLADGVSFLGSGAAFFAQPTIGYRRQGRIVAASCYEYPNPANSSAPAAKFDLNVLTALSIASQDTAENVNYTLYRGNGSSTPGWYVGLHSGSLNGGFAGIGSYGYGPSAGTFDAGPHTTILRADGTNASVFFDGALVGSGTYTAPGYQYGTARALVFGTNNGSGGAQQIRPSLGLVWNRPLSDAEIASINANPWQIFQAPRKLFPSAAVTIQAPSRSIRTTPGAPLSQQPQYPAQIDRSNPLTRGLQIWWTPQTQAAGSATEAVNGRGRGVATDGAAQFKFVAAPYQYGTGFTVIAFADVNWRGGAFERLASLRTSSMATGLQLFDSGGTRTMQAFCGDSAGSNGYTNFVLPTAAQTGAHLYATSSTLDNVAETAFIDGVALSLAAKVISNNGTLQSGASGLDVGRLQNVGTDYFGRYNWIGLSACWNRVLSPSEHAALGANPWQIFQAPRKLFPSAAVTIQAPSRSIRTTPGAPLTQQPQYAARINPKYASRLKFAFVPSIGFLNLASGANLLQQSATLPIGVSASGITYEGNARAEYGATVDANGDLTLISIWRSRQSSQYLGADGTPYILSTRTAGNAGWSWGHSTAIGGGAGGNLIPQQLVLQGVAAYAEQNSTIASLVDTPVACRYVRSTGLISWFAFGKKSSPDTAASTTATVGGNLVFGAQGDYAGNLSPWIDRASAVLAFQGALSDSEIAELTTSTSAVWQIFQAPRKLSFGAAAVQLLRPSSDISAGAWTPSTGVNLFAMLNEAVASDATFDLTSAPSTFEVGLTAGTSPGVTTGHVVRYRIIGAVTVSLKQGPVMIASWSQAPTAMTTYVQTLTSLQAAAITNYAALSLQFQAT